MKRDTMYGGALIAGTLGSVLTMAMHPTGSQLLADVQHLAPVALAVHVLALVTLPFSVFGTLGLTRRLSTDGELPIAAMVAYAMASVAVMIAAVASGLLAPGLFTKIAMSTGSEQQLAMAIVNYNGSINQAFAKVYVFASSAAILLWSVAIISHGRLSRGAGWLGIIVAMLALLAMSIGHLRLDVHGFGAVVLTQGIWMITVGVLLIRAQELPGTS